MLNKISRWHHHFKKYISAFVTIGKRFALTMFKQFMDIVSAYCTVYTLYIYGNNGRCKIDYFIDDLIFLPLALLSKAIYWKNINIYTFKKWNIHIMHELILKKHNMFSNIKPEYLKMGKIEINQKLYNIK